MRRGHRVGLRVAAAGCVLAAGLLWWPVPAGAQSGESEAGWWYRYSGGEGEPSGSGSGSGAGEPGQPPSTLPPAPVPFPTAPLPDDPPAPPFATPPPATVPDGGIYVANDALGAVAMGAIRFNTDRAGEGRLTLQFGGGGTVAGGLPIVACPLLEGFQPVSNGAWRDRPAHDCARAKAGGTVNADGTMAFTLSDSFRAAGSRFFDVVILPDPNDGTPFSATFEAPDAGSLVLAGEPVSDGWEGGAGAPDAVLPAPAPDVGSYRPPAPAVPFPVDAAPAAGPVAEGAVDATGAGPDAAQRRPSGAVQPVVDIREPWRYARPVATALLVALALVLLAAADERLRSHLPVLARIGVAAGGGEQPARGVGRFARARSSVPPALS